MAPSAHYGAQDADLGRNGVADVRLVDLELITPDRAAVGGPRGES